MRALAGSSASSSVLARKAARVVVDVQRADAGRDVEDAAKLAAAQFRFERVDAEAQVEVEDVGAVLDEQVLVAIGADRPCRDAWRENGTCGRLVAKLRQRAGERFDELIQLALHPLGLLLRDGERSEPSRRA